MKHETFEKSVDLLTLCIAMIMSIGGLAQIVPLSFQDVANTPVEDMKLCAAPQLEGRDTYIREGCIGCYSQMIRPSRAETGRCGHYSVTGENVWDHPFPWDSKHTGSGLVHVGSRCSDDWYRTHLSNPRNMIPESKMPAYPQLMENKPDDRSIEKELEVMCTLGVPYTDEDIKGTKDSLKGKTEMDAVAAYPQVLGTPIKNKR